MSGTELLMLHWLASQPSFEILGSLPDRAELLSALMHDFYRAPSPEKAGLLSDSLASFRLHVCCAQEALLREARNPRA